MAIHSKNAVIKQLKAIGGGVLLASLVVGCSPPVDIYDCPSPTATPVVITKEELRTQVQFMPSQPIGVNGKIVVYNDYLLVNEPDVGIHMFDNIQPEMPQPLGLIKVPGNTDFFVRDNIVHATSYVDLVQIDISDLDNVREVSRSIDVFIPNPFHHGWYPQYKFNVNTRTSVVVGVEYYVEPKEGCGEEAE